MRELVERYFDACKPWRCQRDRSCFTEDAVHYFPPGMYGGAFRGGRAVGERWGPGAPESRIEVGP